MRILHIAPIGHHSEGIGTVLGKLYPEQIKCGCEVRIITIYPNYIYPDWPIVKINGLNGFVDYITNWRPDIVVFHSHFHKEYLAFSRYLVNEKIPYCVQLHGALSYHNYKKNFIKKYLAGKLFFNTILKNASKIIYLNQAEYDNSIVPALNNKYAIIPNGCDSPDNINVDIRRKDITDVVFIGRISFYYKGLDILMEAISLLDEEQDSNIRISFYGNEDDVDVIHLKDAIKNSKIASYKGGIYGKEKDRLLRDSDIFLLTSRSEGMPMGVLEAWSYGVPCILTKMTNMVDNTTEPFSYWLTELNSKDIRDTLFRAVNEYRREPIKFREASLRQSKKYSWSKIAKKSIEILENDCE